jgi:dihydroflavonol-4-reductase
VTPDRNDRTVLVTGATGFAGGHLVHALAQEGHRIRCIVRSSSRAKGLPQGVEVREGDITKKDDVSSAMEGVGTVYHLAAAYRQASHEEEGYWRVNVGATKNLLDAAMAERIGRFVHCSTVGVHGHISSPPADETEPYKPGDAYQRTKCEAEVMALAYARDHGLPLTVARPTAIYGPGDMRLLKMFRMISKGTFVILGRGDIYYHMVYIDDLVQGLKLLGSHPAAVGEVFILGGERYYPLPTIAGMVATILGVRPPWLRLPARPFQLAGSLCEAICVPLGLEPPIYRRRVDFFTKSRAFSIAKAQRILGYSPSVSLEAGLHRTLDWCLQTGLIPPRRVVA